MDELYPWGSALLDQEPRALRSDRARAVLAACEAHRAFNVVELRAYESSRLGQCDVVVVRCTNQEVPNRNPAGIRVREILALTVPVDDLQAPEARALRSTFPLVPHVNAVPDGEPKWLCLYAEVWQHARRTWTPQKFLARILWWLKRAAMGTLHAPDQPLERAYFDSRAELILPPGYDGTEPANTRLAVYMVDRGRRCTMISLYSTDTDPRELQHVPVYVRVRRAHGLIDSLPGTLGALVDQWTARGVPLADMIVERLAAHTARGIWNVPNQVVLLVLDIEVTRESGGPVEELAPTAFLIVQSAVSLAYAMGALYRANGMFFTPSPISPTAAADHAEHWRPIKVAPTDARRGLTRAEARRMAGIPDYEADAPRVLIGAGSLGSALAEIWAREGWGTWTFVDPDHVQPHNLVRHRAFYTDLGQFKVNVVKELAEGPFFPGEVSTSAIPEDATATGVPALVEALANASLVVDVSTTLYVPRDLSARGGARRMASAFLTPSGGASVILLEDADRAAPLHCLEPQYYREILRASWGVGHLTGHAGRIAVGAGCRDVSTVMSPEIIELHAAVLARQLRTLSARPEAAIKVWIAANDGSVAVHSPAVRTVRRFESAQWRVILDDEVIDRLRALRAERAPSETGGIIIGYTDHPSRTMYVVDVERAPADSLEEEGGFVRGTAGLHERWKEVLEKTADVVTYIGEWHSHPPAHGASPSLDDLVLVGHLGDVLGGDGEPAAMIIIAEQELAIFVCESDGTTARVSPAVPE